MHPPPNGCRCERPRQRERRHARPATKVDDSSDLSAVHVEAIDAERDRLIDQAGRELAFQLEGSCGLVIAKRSRVAVIVS